jgi:hypothetical protein
VRDIAISDLVNGDLVEPPQHLNRDCCSSTVITAWRQLDGSAV